MVQWLTRALACFALFGATAVGQRGGGAPGSQPQNFIIIFTDDQGYGDLGSYGHPTIRTPHLDRMAAEGQRWTSFYVAPVCTPSRAQLMTARYAIRSGLAAGVLFPNSTGGLQPSEATIAEVLKPRGYATLAVGKWHLGHLPQYLPTNQGFDRYFGIPYSNDMDRDTTIPAADVFRRTMEPKVADYNLPLMRDTTIVERPADQTTITRRYTDDAIAFIRQQQRQPFFIYLAHNLPHVPLFRSKQFEGRSARGIYGDVIEEIDHNVGRILDTLRELKLERQTLVVFLSDNGPWMPYVEQGGSAGLLRGAKGSTWEGGVRVPAIFWQPGTVQPGVTLGIGSAMDLLPTFARLAGASVPAGRPLDGQDLSATLTKGAPSPRETIFYYNGARLTGVRHRAFKLHLAGTAGLGAGRGAPAPVDPTWELYNLDEDPSEKFNLAEKRPEIVRELTAMMEAHQKTVEPFENQIPLGRGRGAGGPGATPASLAAQQAALAVYYSVPSWAPDGRTIAFESNRDGEAAVYTILPDGSSLTRLTPGGMPGEQPNWSTDGRSIVFTSSRDGVRQLYLMTRNGRDPVALPGTTNGFLAAFSPDGRWLLFAAQDKRPSSQYRVIVMHPDGSNRRQLGDSTKSNEDPRWTADGQRIVFTEVPMLERLPNEAPREFVRRRTEAQRLFSITPDGLDTRALQPDEANRLSRDRGLSPDGKWLVYSRQAEGVVGLYLREQSSGTERLLDRGSRTP